MVVGAGVGMTGVEVLVGCTGLGSAVGVAVVVGATVGSGVVEEGAVVVGSGAALEVGSGVAEGEGEADELPEPLLELPLQLLLSRLPTVAVSQLLVPVVQPRRRLAISET